MKARALMYHDVEWPGVPAGGFSTDGARVYAVTDDRFRAHLDGIDAVVGEPPVKAEALLEDRPPGEPWMITFDDGGASAAAAGAELARRAWSAHFFVVTDLVGRPGFLDWDEIAALAAQGHVIGSHTHTHPSLMSACPAQQLHEEWSRSTELIEQATGAPVRTASVPGGYYSRDVGKAAAAAGIKVLFTSEPVRSIRLIDGCLLVGRYAVRRDTEVRDAVGAAGGDAQPWLRQRASWTARGVAKKVGGRGYHRLRAALLARRRDAPGG